MTLDPSSDGGEPYLTVEEAARLIRLSVKTLAKLRVSGGGPRFIKAGIGRRAKVLYRRVDLEAWLASLSFASTSEYHR